MAFVVGGAILGSAAIASAGQSSANAKNQQMAREQMAFQHAMATKAHQHEVADLRLAGLNPILSANKGAASPSGAMAVAKNTAENIPSSAIAAARIGAEIKAMEASANASNAQAAKSTAEATGITADNNKRSFWGNIWSKANSGLDYMQNNFNSPENFWDNTTSRAADRFMESKQSTAKQSTGKISDKKAKPDMPINRNKTRINPDGSKAEYRQGMWKKYTVKDGKRYYY